MTNTLSNAIILVVNYDQFHGKTSAQKKIITDNNFTYRLLLQELNKYIKSKDKVLDIGCGAGTLCLYFAKKGNKILGIDISDKAIKEAKKSVEVLKLKNAEFQTLKFPEKTPLGKFDFVIFTEVIEHIKDDQLAIKKIYSLLNEKGKVLISTPSLVAPLHRLGYARGFDDRVGHMRRYNEKGLINLLEKNNFKIIKIKKIEGVLRNLLFLNSYAGNFVRVMNHSSFASNVFTLIDNISLKLLGNSNIIIVAEKK